MTEHPRSPSALRRFGVYFAALALCLLTLALQRDVNITWDEALGDLFFGQRNLSFLTSFDGRYLDFEADPYPQEHRPDLRSSPLRRIPWEHPPAAATAAAAISNVVSNRLGLMDPLDGFHALNALLGGALLILLWRVLTPRLNSVVALASIGLLFGMPRVWAHQLANIKDFPAMVLFTASLLVFLEGFTNNRKRWIVASGCLWGLALATRPTALFLPIIPLAVWLLAKRQSLSRTQGTPVTSQRPAIATLLIAGCLGPLTGLLAWPYLWSSPIERYRQHLGFLTDRGAATSELSIAPVLEAILLTTPPLTLVLFALGLLPLLQRVARRDPLGILLLVWLLNVPLRYLAPGAVNYDGVRHLLDLFPPLAIVAAMGLELPIRHVRGYVSEHRPRLAAATTGAILTLCLLPGVWASTASHPFQIAYWNTFAGGPLGAQMALKPQAGDYWGFSYRVGIDWLNENAPQDSAIAVPLVEHAVRLVAPERLRKDIGLLNLSTPFSPELRPGWRSILDEVSVDAPVFIMTVHRRDWMNPLMSHCLRHPAPVATWTLAGAQVLSICRW